MRAALLLLACVAIVLLSQLRMLASGQATGYPLDSDGWARLLRVRELWRSGDWYPALLPALSAPEGLSLHWTRPLDLPILAGAWIGVHGFGAAPDTAMLVAGALVCPILLALLAWVTAWAARIAWPAQPLAPGFAIMAIIGNGTLKAYSALGRTDHHVLVALSGALGLALVLKAVDQPARSGAAFAAGLAFGFGIWVVPEALIFAIPVCAVLGAFWALTPGAETAARQGLALCLGMAAMVALAIVTEHPPGAWLATEYDRVSAHHLVVSLAMAAVFLGARRGCALPVPRRVALGLAMTAGAAGVLLGLYPGIVHDVTGAIDSLPELQELRPLGFRTAADWQEAIAFAGIAPAGFIGVLALAWTGRDNGRWRQAALLLAPLVLCFAATLLHRRFGALLALVAAIGAAGIVGLAAHVARGALARVALMLAALVLLVPSVVAELWSAATDAQPAAGAGGEAICDPARLAPWLVSVAEADGLTGTAPIVLTADIDPTAELAWRTPLRFVAAPYHRGQAAFADSYAFYRATDPAAAEAVLRRRGIAYVMLCEGSFLGDGAFARRLAAGEAPPWLEPVPAPSAAGPGVRLWRVR